MASADRKKSIPIEHLAAAMISLSLRNSTEVVVPAVHFITEILHGAVAETEIRWIKLGLQEALRNSLEHGNQTIGAKQKVRLNPKGRVLEKRTDRRGKSARNHGKLVEFNAAFADGVFFCSIEDAGIGFDWRRALKQAQRPPAATESEGRGLFLLKNIFDQIKYNRSGNKITLIKEVSAKKGTGKKNNGAPRR